MYQQRRILRFGAAAILLALGIRLASAGFFQPITQDFSLICAVFSLETGRIPPKNQPSTPSEPAASENPSQPVPSAPENALPAFSGADLIDVKYDCAYRPDLPALIEKSLQWDLSDGKAAVLILHTHATESYTGNYTESDDYRTLDERENMLSIGDEVARILEAGGITVIHDRTLHDYPDYNAAYASSRAAVLRYLAEYPSIRLVLDLHRDASSGSEGQMVTAATVGGQKSAQLMMVVGTDAGGNAHPNWQDNLSLALQLSAALEQENPGICRPLSLRAQRFNLDLSPGSLLIEVGAAGNTHQEAMIAANALAQGILTIAKGANT